MVMTPVRARQEPPSEDPLQQSEAVVAEVVDALLEPDRAHHNEIGRTENGPKTAGTAERTSPREQPAAPIDLEESVSE